MKNTFFQSLFIRLKLDSFISSHTFRNLSTLFTGTLLSAAIPIIFSPVMSRIYTTSDYGVLGLYMSISGLIGVIAYVHYPQAIMLSKSDEEARQVMWFSISFCLMIALISFIVISILYFVTDVFNYATIGLWLFFVPLSVFLNGISIIILTWANRQKQYKILSFSRIWQACLTVVVQIILGLTITNETGLIVGLLLGQLVSIVLLYIRFKNLGKASLLAPKIVSFKNIALNYKNLLIYTTPSEFINNLINQTPIFLLQKFGGVSYVGSYNFTQRILGLPQLFLSGAIVEVFKQKASNSYNREGNCKNIFIKTFKALTVIAIVPFVLIGVFAPDFFAFIFGEQWREAGVFAQFLSILFFLRFIISPLTYVYIIAGKVKEDFFLHVCFLIITTLSFYIGNQFFEDKTYLILVYALSYGLIYLVYLLRAFKFSKGG